MNGFVRSALLLLAEMLRCLILGGSLILGDVGDYISCMVVYVPDSPCSSDLGGDIFGITWFCR